MKIFSITTHIASALIITIIMLLIYACIQQNFRASANDPQMQIARDLSALISDKKSVEKYFETDTINLTQSLATFIELFDVNGNPLQSTGMLNAKLPQPPKSIFEYTKENAEDIITWQPQQNVRLAMVFKKVSANNGGFVAVGRSLKEVEIREANLLKTVGAAWIISVLIILIHFFISAYYLKRKPNNH